MAGVTQDAVPVGGTPRLPLRRPPHAGTYWYHAHQLSHEQVERGLLGALVVDPPGAAVDERRPTSSPSPTSTPGGAPSPAARGDVAVPAAPGTPVRLRVINTDNGPLRTWVDGAPFRVVAVDGTTSTSPTPVTGTSVDVAGGSAGGPGGRRAGDGSATIGGSSALVIGPPGARHRRRRRQPEAVLDLLHYGTPAPLGFDPATAARTFEYAIGRRPGLPGRPPGAVVDDQRAPVPRRADVHGGAGRRRAHAHHEHERRGAPDAPARPPGGRAGAQRGSRRRAARGGWTRSTSATGRATTSRSSPTTPGSGSDHCHNLVHAKDGLVAHLMYAGVTPSYRIGGINVPE